MLVTLFSDATITAVDAGSAGRELWSNRSPEFTVASVAVVGGEVTVVRYPIQSGESRVPLKGLVESFDLASGRLVRRLTVQADQWVYSGLCSVDSTRIYLTGIPCDGTRCVQAVGRSTGQLVWSQQVDPQTLGPGGARWSTPVPLGRPRCSCRPGRFHRDETLADKAG